jgi:hypothetical protein
MTAKRRITPSRNGLRAKPQRLVVARVQRPRVGWSLAAKALHEEGKDNLLDGSTATHFDREQWYWR